MAKKLSPSKRLAKVAAEINDRIEALADRLPLRRCKKLKKLCSNFRKGARGPCDAEQAAYNALVLSAAQKQIDAEDAQADADAAQDLADQKQSDANIEFMLALAAYVVLQNCLNP